MLRSTTQHTKMRLFLVLAFAVLTCAQPRCDHETEYEKNGACCKKCPPGYRMLLTGTGCDEPRCEECGANEYQDAYTIESKCKPQPYCDPNKNFNPDPDMSKTKKIKCECKLGFHCSSAQCMTCVPHTVCPPGEGAKIKGSHSQDTVCEKCPEDTFSNESSWMSGCKSFTQCGNDYHIKEAGTSTSDNICEENSRTHITAIVVPIVLVIVAVFGIVGFLVWRKGGHAGGKVKGYLKPMGAAGEKEPQGAAAVIDIPTENQFMMHPDEEDLIVSGPEENDDSQSLDRSLEVGYTVNGQPVQQDMSKTEQLSQEESQSTNL